MPLYCFSSNYGKVACEFGCALWLMACRGQDHSIQGCDFTDEQGSLMREAIPWFDVYTLVKVLNVDTKEMVARPCDPVGH